MIAAKYNPCTIYFHAQTYIIDLYKKIGFKEKGEEFLEAGIKHILMTKDF